MEQLWQQLVKNNSGRPIDPKQVRLGPTAYTPVFGVDRESGKQIIAWRGSRFGTSLERLRKSRHIGGECVDIPDSLSGFGFDGAFALSSTRKSIPDEDLITIAEKHGHEWLKPAGRVVKDATVEELSKAEEIITPYEHEIGWVEEHLERQTDENKESQKRVFYEPVFQRFYDPDRQAELRCIVDAKRYSGAKGKPIQVDSPFDEVRASESFIETSDVFLPSRGCPSPRSTNEYLDESILHWIDRESKPLSETGGMCDKPLYTQTHRAPHDGGSRILSHFYNQRSQSRGSRSNP